MKLVTKTTKPSGNVIEWAKIWLLHNQTHHRSRPLLAIIENAECTFQTQEFYPSFMYSLCVFLAFKCTKIRKYLLMLHHLFSQQETIKSHFLKWRWRQKLDEVSLSETESVLQIDSLHAQWCIFIGNILKGSHLHCDSLHGYKLLHSH